MRAVERRRAGLVEAAVVVAFLTAYVVYVWPTLGRPLLEKHAFRQTQTAFTARIYHEDGIDLLHPKLPVLGEPFEVPFEFPLFQAAASVVMDLGVADDRAMRVTGLACFLLTALLLFGLVRHVAGRVSAFAALAAFVFTPFALVWGRASLMEYLATAGAVGCAWAAIAWRERGRPLPYALALAAGLVGMLVKPTTALFWFLPALAYRPASAPTRVRRTHVATAALVAVPLLAAVLWTRHADAIKAASKTTEWLASGELRDWNLGTLDQRFALETWDVILARIGLTLLAPVGVGLLAVAIAAAYAADQRRFWIGVWAAAVGPLLVFTNLYFQHDYYLVAISPALAALIGLGAGFLWSRVPRRPAYAAGMLIVALLGVYSTLEFGRSYWLRIHGAEDDPAVLPLAAQIAAHTEPDDRIALAIDDWTPAYLYYARRWGHMVVAETEDVAYDLIREHDYRYFVAYDHKDLRPLERWRYVAALDRNLYALGDERADVEEAPLVATSVRPASARAVRPLTLVCDGRTRVVPVPMSGAWLSFAGPDASARLWASDELAGVPLRRYAWVDGRLARAGEVALRCTRT
jgi:MFS family permease